MKVFRLCHTSYAHRLDGEGASKYGGRWNSKSVPIVYTAESRSLALLEVLVHTDIRNMKDNFAMVEIEVPDEAVCHEIHRDSLGQGWNRFPSTRDTVHFGDDFIRKKSSLLLRVPSSIIEGECNILINPNHEGFSDVKVGSIKNFTFDDRLF